MFLNMYSSCQAWPFLGCQFAPIPGSLPCMTPFSSVSALPMDYKLLMSMSAWEFQNIWGFNADRKYCGSYYKDTCREDPQRLSCKQ